MEQASVKIEAEVYEPDSFGDYYVTHHRTLDVLPCPFCGETPHAEIQDEKLKISCPNCGITQDTPRPIEEAITQWNRRI